MIRRGVNVSFGTHPLLVQRRYLKTLDVREYKPLGTPIEFRFYQRYTRNPVRKAGVVFNTHYEDHRRYNVKEGRVDWLWWGKENGQAQLAHRHQRVAFDFNDQLHPTNAPAWTSPKNKMVGQDPSMTQHPNVSSSFDANAVKFNTPVHNNKMYTLRLQHRPSDREYRPHYSFNSTRAGTGNLRDSINAMGDTLDINTFGNSWVSDPSVPKGMQPPPNQAIGRVPGLNAPFLGEPDSKMMLAMAGPVSGDKSICKNEGRYSASLYINTPQKHNTLHGKQARELNYNIDKNVNGLRNKMLVLTAAQSGMTDYFCGGLDLEYQGERIERWMEQKEEADRLTKAAGAAKSKKTKKALEAKAHAARETARQYAERVDDGARQSMALLWRVFSAPKQLMTIVNGRCNNIGNGLALNARFAGLRDSTEFVHDGPAFGLTPFGGLTHYLARTETSLKFPGVAEFVMLTGAPLYAGDALRLGWSDLFSTLPDMDYHTKQWFDDSEHLHNDAVAWQTGQLLDSCWKMKEHHAVALERTALNATRRKWVEEIFADQPSVESIMESLSQVEKLPLTDAMNNADSNASGLFTLPSVGDAIEKLEARNMKFALAPWEVTPPSEEVDSRQAGEVFSEYFLERYGTTDVAVPKGRAAAEKWQAERLEEYREFKRTQLGRHPRHVFVKMEGCEGTLVDFEFDFDRTKCVRAMSSASSKSDKDGAMVSVLKRAALQKLGMPVERDVQLGWATQIFDTAPIFDDEDMLQVLLSDPGVEIPKFPTRLPPLYLTIRREQLHFSEWAFAVKHQMLMASPFALKASLQLLQQVRGDGSEGGVMSMSETLATEFRYLTRMQRRPDFYAVGQYTSKSVEDWKDSDAKVAQNVHESDGPTRRTRTFDEVFDKNVKVDGHTFLVRPRWSAKSLADVNNSDISALALKLDFQKDGVAELHVPSFTDKGFRVIESANEVGLEVVAGLGEVNSSGKQQVAPLESTARCPNNVSFYKMARHPWMETETSWRIDGFTEGSQALFERQYREAERAVHDPQGNGSYTYFPGKDAVEGSVNSDETLLTDRLWTAVSSAESLCENWVRNMREPSNKFNYLTEIANTEEKVYDDEYYRWFIEPGVHPNPSGVLVGRVSRTAADAGNAGEEEAGEEEPIEDFTAVQAEE